MILGTRACAPVTDVLSDGGEPAGTLPSGSYLILSHAATAYIGYRIGRWLLRRSITAKHRTP